jgi:DNA-binding MarR family transcriptional regulator
MIAASAAKSSSPSTVDMAASLRLSATRLARRLRQESDAGLTPSQLSALASIQNEGPLTLGALADHERIAPPTVTRVVSKLEADGLVQRAPDPGDGRIWRVSTTAKGDALLAELRKRKNAWLAGRLAELDSSQRARLADALDVLDLLASKDLR